MKKSHPIIALAFFVSGVLISCGIFLFVQWGNSLGGMGDNASSGTAATTATLILPYGSYFLFGIISCFIPWRVARFVLGILAHILPFTLFAEVKNFDPRIVTTILMINLFIYVSFSFAWYQLLRMPKNKIQPI